LLPSPVSSLLLDTKLSDDRITSFKWGDTLDVDLDGIKDLKITGETRYMGYYLEFLPGTTIKKYSLKSYADGTLFGGEIGG